MRNIPIIGCLTSPQENHMNTREWTPEGVDAAIRTMRSVIAEGNTLGDDDAIGRHLDDLEREGVTEIDSSRTESGRPELVVADPSWFR